MEIRASRMPRRKKEQLSSKFQGLRILALKKKKWTNRFYRDLDEKVQPNDKKHTQL